MDTERRAVLGALAAGVAALPLTAQDAASPRFVPKQSDRPEPQQGDEPGFRPIFDGKTLDGWEGNPAYWGVEDGCIVGEITPDNLIRSNTFLIWRSGAPKDFELKADYRLTAGGNSGINYRSVEVPDLVTPGNKFVLRGYQADIDGRDQYTGQNYEEKGRLFLAMRGQVTHVLWTQKPIILASLGDIQELAASMRNTGVK
jgi:Domain of Unknown Function (DUF1080)